MIESSNAVEMTGIKKSFGGLHVLRGVDFAVKQGTVHALMGENGAGKSTLLKILQGILTPTEGSISVFGRQMNIFSAATSRALGIGMIFQELSLIPSLTVAQNIFLAREPRKFGLLVDDRAARDRSRVILSELGMDVDPATPVEKLSTGQMQMVEIAKAISQDARVLILDEPTSALTGVEVERLFSLLKRLSADGVAIVYVSHRMDEIFEIAEEVTILRDGRNVATALLRQLEIQDVVEHMIGKRVGSFSWRPRSVDRTGCPALEVRSVSGPNKPINASFEVHSGEVLGIAGLLGSGRSELARVLFGIDPMTSGEIRVKDQAVRIRSPSDAMAAGVALIPESRAREGLIAAHSIRTNLSLPRLGDLARGPFLDDAKEAASATGLIQRLRIKATSSSVPVRTLSGGNQQKVVLGKWLAMNPEILILDEPTAGIDIGSKTEIVELIRELADEGRAIIIISSELAELLAVSDRVLILSDGRIAREVSRDEISMATGEPTGNADDGMQIAKAEHNLQVLIQEVRLNAPTC
ncbi:sugar ABC transporter ATP-binding protein [Bradyrhizobium zhanjiangense]|uniref:Sugar ABC transporter ATP-binding protein n=1 Tax=Bradyrhizobium zhanjiangense TaxID=1325107 RepID=A0A4Q0STN2_9BRAD|nr:sugar ABC transporter ATP-binding protein [Bradyrhizobium zhanjiangense]RXH41511.1 sugar ABC transporter ATP-binding protein [Bradyrhizobium zhanjiangense]